jgi:hypothetical protein
MKVRAQAVSTCLFACVFGVLLGAGDAHAQYFGRNKVGYHDFDFKTLETDHFDIYYYPREEQAAREAARMAERWYARLSLVLKHTFSSRQPLILYGSHPEFTQTNVIPQFLDESVGGVTEAVRRRIVLPFAPGLGETDHVLGHEIVHAFQMDIIRKQKWRVGMPLWFAEGMAEYLSVGAGDALTAAWLRDAAIAGELPTLKQFGRDGVSPYRFGQAFWAYLAGRYGDGFIEKVLHSDGKGDVMARVARVAGEEPTRLFADWHAAVLADYRPALDAFKDRSDDGHPLVAGGAESRLNLAPALSPDGRRMIFLSEKDKFSVDLFVADGATGVIARKLLTRTADQHLESLQFVNSSGAWDPTGRQFMISAIRGGVPVLIVFDVASGARVREIRLPQLGEIFTPTWSPDAGSVAFAALEGGLTNLYIYELATDHLRRLTDDAFTDLQPAWSPDGTRIAFVTDRFTSDVGELRFGAYQLATLAVASGVIEPLPGFADGKNVDPQWSRDGASLFFIANPDGISNVFRLDLASDDISQITDVATGVMGLTSSSPALTVASSTGTMAFSVFRHGRYEIRTLEAGATTVRRDPADRPFADAGVLPPHVRQQQAAELRDPAFGLPSAVPRTESAYVSRLKLEGFGQPYFSSGGSRLGTFAYGGTSFLFGDMLGERKLGTAFQIGANKRDLAGQMRYLDRKRRWNWGATADVLPYLTGGSRDLSTTQDGETTLVRETEVERQTHASAGGFLSYPFSRAERIEVSTGIGHISTARQIRSRTYSLSSRRLLSDVQREEPGAGDATFSETGVALIYDSALWGPVAPILGTRARLQVSPTVGGLSLTTMLLDYRHYFMPLRPFTLATRVLYDARFGRDANDSRLPPLFVGYRNLVRGYDFTSLAATCTSTVPNECPAVDRLTGARSAVANVELRFPLVGLLSRTQSYGPIPLEGVLFADGGLAGRSLVSAANWRDHAARSAGAAIRVAPFGFLAEIGVVRTFDHPLRRWTFLLDFRPGF